MRNRPEEFDSSRAMAPPAIADWLESGIARAGNHVTIVAQRAYTLTAVSIDMPALIVPLAGIKRLELGTDRDEVHPGQFVMVHQATRLNVENRPHPTRNEPYRAWVIAVPWHLVKVARTLLDAHTLHTEPHTSTPFSSGPIDPLLPSLQHLLTLLTQPGTPDPALADHALLGVLLALARCGHGQFLQACDPSLSARIRLLVAAAPEREWNSALFEEALHVSGATLRRHLAKENTSLRTLLREARLHHGLALLQTTRKPVKSIAQACGYRSASSFSRNFVAHFGVDPSAVANP
jgi:AraC-like DNA-binding protein